MRKVLLLAIALFLVACAPSKVEPSVTTKSFSAFGGLYTKVTSRTLNVPTPKPFSFKFDGDWELRTDFFSLEKQLAFFTCNKELEHIQFRAMNKVDLYHDTTFVAEKGIADDEFIRYYLKWDFDYWANKSAELKQGTTTGPVYNSEKKYGTIKTVKGNYQRCVLAGLEDGAIYMMTGEALDSEKDICETEAEIWESRDPF